MIILKQKRNSLDATVRIINVLVKIYLKMQFVKLIYTAVADYTTHILIFGVVEIFRQVDKCCYYIFKMKYINRVIGNLYVCIEIGKISS